MYFVCWQCGGPKFNDENKLENLLPSLSNHNVTGNIHPMTLNNTNPCSMKGSQTVIKFTLFLGTPGDQNVDVSSDICVICLFPWVLSLHFGGFIRAFHNHKHGDNVITVVVFGIANGKFQLCQKLSENSNISRKDKINSVKFNTGAVGAEVVIIIKDKIWNCQYL